MTLSSIKNVIKQQTKNSNIEGIDKLADSIAMMTVTAVMPDAKEFKDISLKKAISQEHAKSWQKGFDYAMDMMRDRVVKFLSE